jgi:hypothetical protein
MIEAKAMQETIMKQAASITKVLPFHPEDGSDMFPQNVC